MCDLIDVTLLYMSGTTVHVIIPANCKMFSIYTKNSAKPNEIVSVGKR